MPKTLPGRRKRGPQNSSRRSGGFINLFDRVSRPQKGLLRPVSALSRIQALVMVGLVASVGVTAVMATRAATTTYSLWSSTDKPKAVASWDAGKSVELGVKFSANTNGSVLGVRFYKAAKNTGTHRGHLWDNQGKLLAEATFTNETASGWQSVSFAQPVAIKAGQEYVVSYHTNQGYYGMDEYYFQGNSRVQNGLTAPASTRTSPNGVAKYGTGFPNTSYHSSNYWVDVMFRPPFISTPTPAATPSASATPKPTVTPSSTPAPTPTPAPSTGLLRPYGLGIAPYHYIPWGGSLDSARAGSGVKTYVAAFVLSSSGCTPAWDGDPSLGINSARGNEIASDFARLRANGGDVMLSFGGASGTELAVACTSTTSLKQAYRSVVDRYGLTMIDFDIEGTTASNSTANARRADALKLLQQELPNLKIFTTLSVEPSGLGSTGKGIVQQFRDKGVALTGVNIMVMDYGMSSTQMGTVAIQSANGTFTQLKSLYPSYSDAQIWRAIGLTAMIGKNDTLPETFTLANAQQLHDFAVQKGVGMLSYWNVARDQACPNNAGTLSDSCSGVAQTQYQFAKTMTIPALR